jgi:uncharacterized damage-inducible protein DinB
MPTPTDEAKKYAPAGEREALGGFLDKQREALIRKVEGLDDATARRTPTESSLSLLALIKHSAIWERRWFQVITGGREFPGEWPAVEGGADEDEEDDLVVDESDTVEHWVAYYREQIAQSRAVVASMELDEPCRRPEIVASNVRWVVFHMIEETARHAGHADIIRETIDGSRGL